MNASLRFVTALGLCVWACSCDGGLTVREKAEHRGASARFLVKVVDEDQSTIAAADTEVYFGMTVREGKTVRGTTDEHGCFSAEGKTTGEVYVNIKKRGYYDSALKIDLVEDESRDVKNGSWMPEVIVTNILLRSIEQPVRLVTSSLARDYAIPSPCKIMGFDLEAMDWVLPLGKGKTVDFEVCYESDGKKLFDYSGSKLHVKFVRPFDGAYYGNIDTMSKLTTLHRADTNAIFLGELNFWEERLPDKKFISNKLAKDKFLVLRTRSQTDAKGKFLGAHYSLIVGEWSFGWAWKDFACMGFRSFFNPTFNDPNLEQMNIYNTPNFNQIGSPSSKMDKRD